MEMVFNNRSTVGGGPGYHELDLPPPLRDWRRDMSRYAMETLVALPEGRVRLRHLGTPNINRTLEENERLRAAVAARALFLAGKNLTKGDNSYNTLLKSIQSETDWELSDIESAVGFAELYGLRVNRLKMTFSLDSQE